MVRVSVRRLKEEEFERAVEGLILRPKPKNLAKQVMVKGEEITAVAEAAGMTRQGLNGTIKKIWDHWMTIK